MRYLTVVALLACVLALLFAPEGHAQTMSCTATRGGTSPIGHGPDAVSASSNACAIDPAMAGTTAAITGPGQFGCFDSSNVKKGGGSVSCAMSCGPGATLVNGQCQGGAATDGACKPRENVSISACAAWDPDAPSSVPEIQQDGCVYQIQQADPYRFPDGHSELCGTWSGTGETAPAVGSGSLNNGVPVSSGNSTPANTAGNNAPANGSTGDSSTASRTGASTGTADAGKDTANLGRIATNTATTIDAVDRNTATQERIGSIEMAQLGEIADAVKANKPTSSGACGGVGQPQCAAKLDEGNTDTTRTSTNADLAAKQTSVDQARDGQAHKLDGTGDPVPDAMPSGGRWTLSLPDVLSLPAASCTYTMHLDSGSLFGAFDETLDMCAWGPYIRDVEKWVLYGVTVLTLWSILFARKEAS